MPWTWMITHTIPMPTCCCTGVNTRTMLYIPFDQVSCSSSCSCFCFVLMIVWLSFASVGLDFLFPDLVVANHGPEKQELSVRDYIHMRRRYLLFPDRPHPVMICSCDSLRSRCLQIFLQSDAHISTSYDDFLQEMRGLGPLCVHEQ